MRPSYKPEGYSSVAPYLIVDGARASLDFLESVFGGEVLRLMPDADRDRLTHAEVRIDDTVIMLADAVEGWPSAPAHVHIYVPDVDAAYQRAIDAGAQSVQAPVQKGDADRRGGVRDAGGTTWWIATEVN